MEIAEAVLMSDYTIMTAINEGAYKSIYTNGSGKAYELPSEDLGFISSLPRLDKSLREGGIMVSNRDGVGFKTVIGKIGDISNAEESFTILAECRKLDYPQSIMGLEEELAKTICQPQIPTEPEYQRISKGEIL